ncbi:hypothetical protein [Lacticaseibacillus manihotivorans]|nr:hypothetical protein [Lacticaseibacillus manihotivorans]
MQTTTFYSYHALSQQAFWPGIMRYIIIGIGITLIAATSSCACAIAT